MQQHFSGTRSQTWGLLSVDCVPVQRCLTRTRTRTWALRGMPAPLALSCNPQWLAFKPGWMLKILSTLSGRNRCYCSHCCLHYLSLSACIAPARCCSTLQCPSGWPANLDISSRPRQPCLRGAVESTFSVSKEVEARERMKLIPKPKGSPALSQKRQWLVSKTE